MQSSKLVMIERSGFRGMDSRPGIDPADVSRVHQSADFAVDSACVSVDDKNGFVGWTNQVSTEKAGAGNRAIWGTPFAQVTVQWFTHSRNDINFSCKTKI
jgi:hypothetical protein